MTRVKKQKGTAMIIACLSVALFFTASLDAYAAPEFMTSWSAESFVPDWYRGMVFPTYGSRVNVGFDVVEGGKIVDISKMPVRWYVNNDLVMNETYGNGIRSYSFVNQGYGTGGVSVRVMIPNYNGEAIGTTIAIPTKESELVFDIPYFQRKIERKENRIHAWPFFFNIKDIKELSFGWKANGIGIKNNEGDSTLLFFSAGERARSGSQFNFEASVTSKSPSVFEVRREMAVELK